MTEPNSEASRNDESELAAVQREQPAARSQFVQSLTLKIERRTQSRDENSERDANPSGDDRFAPPPSIQPFQCSDRTCQNRSDFQEALQILGEFFGGLIPV